MVSVVYEASVKGPAGYEVAARNYIYELSRVGVDVELHPLGWFSGLNTNIDPKMSRVLDECKEIKVDPKSPVIFHTVPGRYNRCSSWTDTERYRIGYSVYECTKIPDYWPRRLHSLDELWTPSSFSKKILDEQSGLPAEQIRLMPHGVRFSIFNPNVKPLEIKNREGYLFLFAGTQDLRKGIDLTVEAFLRAFPGSEYNGKTSLLLKSHRTGQRESDMRGIIHWVLEAKKNAEISSHDTPKILFNLASHLTPRDLARLYRSADCFVMLTRCEGWGLTLSEAMACGLPCVATGWGGSLEFFHSSIGYPVPISGLETNKRHSAFGPDAEWAVPDIEKASEILRWIFDNQKTAEKTGRKASREMKRKWSWRRVALKMKARLEEVSRR